MKIYTKTGDAGETSLFDGTRVRKTDPRVAAYGDVDELQASLGVAAAAGLDARARGDSSSPSSAIYLRSAPAWPIRRIASRRACRKWSFDEESIARLEGWIDSLEAGLPPSGTSSWPAARRPGASLHLARTVCRRAERAVLVARRWTRWSRSSLIYLNRLSDLLFVMARAANHRARCRRNRVVNDAYAACLQIAREHYENFPVASRLVPASMRPHVAAIYAFATRRRRHRRRARPTRRAATQACSTSGARTCANRRARRCSMALADTRQRSICRSTCSKTC